MTATRNETSCSESQRYSSSARRVDGGRMAAVADERARATSTCRASIRTTTSRPRELDRADRYELFHRINWLLVDGRPPRRRSASTRCGEAASCASRPPARSGPGCCSRCSASASSGSSRSRSRWRATGGIAGTASRRSATSTRVFGGWLAARRRVRVPVAVRAHRHGASPGWSETGGGSPAAWCSSGWRRSSSSSRRTSSRTRTGSTTRGSSPTFASSRRRQGVEDVEVLGRGRRPLHVRRQRLCDRARAVAKGVPLEHAARRPLHDRARCASSSLTSSATSRRNHLSKGVAWYALFAIPGAWAIARVTRRRGGMRRPEAVPLALLVLAVLTLVAQPLQNVISRHLEAEADWRALETTRDPSAMIGLFQRVLDHEPRRSDAAGLGVRHARHTPAAARSHRDGEGVAGAATRPRSPRSARIRERDGYYDVLVSSTISLREAAYAGSAFVLLLVVGTVGYSLLLDENPFDALFRTVNTIYTAGLVDAPDDTAAKVFTLVARRRRCGTLPLRLRAAHRARGQRLRGQCALCRRAGRREA